MSFLRGVAQTEMELEIKLLDSRRVTTKPQAVAKEGTSTSTSDSNHPQPWKKFKARARPASSDGVPFPLQATADLLRKIDEDNSKHGGVALARAALAVIQRQDIANRCAIVRVDKSRIQTQSGRFTVEETDLNIQILYPGRSVSGEPRSPDHAPSTGAPTTKEEALSLPHAPIRCRSWCVESSTKVVPSSIELSTLTEVGKVWDSKLRSWIQEGSGPSTLGDRSNPSPASYPKFLFDLCSSACNVQTSAGP